MRAPFYSKFNSEFLIVFIRTAGYRPFTELMLDVVNVGALLHGKHGNPRSQVAGFPFEVCEELYYSKRDN